MNNETYSSRFNTRSKIASIVLTASMMASSFTGLGATLVSTTVEAANSYGLATKIEDGNILHCFNWTLAQIKEELPNIAKAGFTSVQTSPLQGHDASGTWYWLYQPTGFNIGNELGSYEDLKSLCSAADEYGIKVIVDVVANHLAGWNDGRWASDLDSKMQNSEYFHNEGACSNWNNRYDITHKNIGMPDLNSENEAVQNIVAEMVSSMKSAGVDGIRWDAAKHIGLPSEGCGFWSKMSSLGMYNYGEILDGPAGSDYNNDGSINQERKSQNDALMTEYGKYIGVTDERYCGSITGSIRDGSTTDSNGNWSNRGVSSNRCVYWAESHDTYCNNGWTNGLSENIMDRAYAVLGARANSQALYLSRPFEKSHESIMYGKKGSTHFTSAEVAAVNHFHNAMVGTKEYFTTAENCFVVCRGGGAVVVNAGGGSKSVTVPNGGGLVPAGTYTDEITGSTWTVTSSTMTGQIGNTGIAVFYKGGSVVGGSVSASPAGGSFTTDTMSVTLNCSDATNTTYTTSEGASGSFTNGQKITIGASTAVGGKVTLTLKGTGTDGSALDPQTYTFTKKSESDKVCIYMDNSSYKWSSVYAYVYDESSGTAKSMAAWPGVKMTDKSSKGYFKLDVSGYEANGQVIFNDGTGSATNRYPADMQPGMKIAGSSKLFSAGNKWEDYSEDPVTKDPTVTVDKATGTSFTTETFDITLSLANATSGTYSVDNGPEKTFTSATKVTIGEGKIGDSDVTVKATATNGTTTKTYTFTYKKKYVVKTSSTSAAALTGKYATNPNGQVGGKGVTITSASDFKESMIIAQGVANDDPRIFRGSHEAPVYDTYALYAAWDDTNLYLGWQFTNVTDVVDPAQGYPISDNGKPWNGDIPQMIAFNLGKGKSADMSKGTLASGYVWGLKVGFETDIDALMCFSSKPKVGKPALFKTDSTGYFNYDYADGVIDFTTGGISFKYEDGFFGSSITGINGNGYAGYKPADLTSSSSSWVDFLSLGHDKAQDTFYTMTIPLATLGITRSYLESTGIGVMHISTFGEGGIASTPMDMTFLDNATEPYSADESTSQEKADTDLVTVPLARIGAGGGNTPIDPDDPDDPDDPTTPLQVNFGTDRSAPQLSTTALTIKGIGYGGTAPYKYEFSVDGKVVKASSTTATVSWTPTTEGKHTLKCVITDSTGATATATKTFTSEGGTPVTDELVNNSTVSATTINLGSTITAKAAAAKGTAPYTYAVLYKKSTQSSWTTVSAYSSTATATVKPASTGDYQICIKVKDSTGTEVKKFFDITVNSVNTLTNNSTVSATTINLGGTVKVTAKGSGGTTPYTYQIVYKKSTQTNWTTASAYSTTTTATIKPASSGTYNICAKVKDKTGTEVKKFFDITVKAAALTNNSTVSPTSIALGSTVKATAVATGGTSPYTYQIVYKKSTQTNWTTASAYSTTATANIKPASTGAYQICIKVKDKTGTEVKKFFDITVKAALVNNSTLSATSIKLGNTATVKGAATGGSGYYNFAVYYKRTSQTSWTTAQAYKSNTTVSFKPAAATTYDVCVKVKDSAGTEVKKYLTLKVTNAALTNTSTISAASVALGNTVTVKGSATGGTTPYKYAVYYKASSSSTWNTKQDFSTNASVSIKFTGTGTKDVCVKVKDNSGTVVKKYFTVKVTSAALANTSTLSATSVTLGNSVTVKCAATGGTTPYKYAVYYKASSASTWSVKQDFSTTASTSIKFTGTGTKDVCVKVKDNAGTVVKKYFTVKVTSAALANTSTVSATSVTLGNSVTVKCAATGGTAPYKYAVYYKASSSSTWNTKQDFSSTTSTSIKFAGTGTKDVCVKVKDNTGTVVKKYFTVTVK